MLLSIFSLILNVVAGLLAWACLMRVYMQWMRLPFGNPLGQFVLALTNWIVLPLRRILPQVAQWDVAGTLAAFLIVWAQLVLMMVVTGSALWWSRPLSVVIMAVFELAQVAISGFSGLLILYAVLSWVQTRSVLYNLVERLCMPILKPVQKIMPLIGGVDLSPMAAILGLQILRIVLTHLQSSALAITF